MSRRIVQIAAVATKADENVITIVELYALDNNGVAWLMVDPGQSKKWERLPELPTIVTRPPAPVLEGAEP
jgi:hypothetical protein